MRLLHAKEYRLYSFEGEGSTPSYAILSHTWNEDEVTFDDIAGDKYRRQAGFVKIRYCCEQALADGFEYVVGIYRGRKFRSTI
jgi:hypothetical protein